ncbi:MAG: hypothetical protein J0L61_04025 [Planctomycetes bacterium]|nr:hypothetical protein [Planctomycetota bacterium]
MRPATTSAARLAAAPLSAASALLALAGLSHATPPGVEVIAVTGTPTSDGVIDSFSGSPTISSDGELAWSAFLTGTSMATRNDSAKFRGTPGLIVEIARENTPLPDGNGLMSAPIMTSVNAAGAVAGIALFSATAQGDDDDSGIMIGSGGPLAHVARQGGPLPGVNGTISSIDSVHLGDSGAVTFSAFSADAVPNSVSGIFRTGGGPFTTIAKSGQFAPGGIGTYDLVFGSYGVNPAGAVAFRADLAGVGDNLNDGRVYLFNGVNTITIAREGDPSPDLNGQLWNGINFILAARVSNNNAVAFRTELLGTSGGASDNEAIFRGAGGPLTLIARRGQPAPGGNGTIEQVFIPDVGDSGVVAFPARFAGTSGGESDNAAILAGNGGPLTAVIREGQPTPSGDGVIGDDGFAYWGMNDNGEMFIRTALANTQAGGNNENALYFHRPGQPLIELVRNGTPLLGSTVDIVTTTLAIDAPEAVAINDAGQVAFRVYLADDRQAILRFTPPPTCLGDFNHDGQRDTADLVMFLGQFGQGVAPWGVGDMNGDGFVSTPDLTIFLGVFGRPCR